MSSSKDASGVSKGGDLTILVGKVRRWHLIILSVIFANSLFNAFGQLAMAFILPDVSYSCSRTEEARRVGLSQQRWIELTQAGTPSDTRQGYCVRRRIIFGNTSSDDASAQSDRVNGWDTGQTDLVENGTATNSGDGTLVEVTTNLTETAEATTVAATPTTRFDYRRTTEMFLDRTNQEAEFDDSTTEHSTLVNGTQSGEAMSKWFVDNETLIHCRSWVFDRSVHKSTILEQWQLVCDRDYLRPFPQALSMAGLIVGNVFFSHFSDHFGRRLAVYSGAVLCALAGLTAMATSNFFVFNIARFFSSVSKIGIQASIVIFLETSDSSSRWMFSMLNGIGFHLGMGAVALIAYHSPSWRYLQGLISAPAIVLLPFLYFVWESPRWLLSKKRIEQGIVILTRIAAMNGVTDDKISAEIPAIRQRYNSLTIPKPTSAADLFRTSSSGGNMALVTVILWYLCFTSGLLFYSAVFLSTSLGDRPHTSFCVPILGEVCAIVLVAWGVRYMRRRVIVCLTATLSAFGFVTLAVASYTAAGEPRFYTEMSAVILVRSSTAAFTQLYPVYGAELYSTPLRNVGISFCDLMCRLASTIDPFGRYWLPRINKRLLPSLYAAMSFLAAGLALLLPETLNRELDDGISTRKSTSGRRKVSVFSIADENHKGKVTPSSTQASQMQVPSGVGYNGLTPGHCWSKG